MSSMSMSSNTSSSSTQGSMSLVGLDFNSIKNNLKTYLQSQDTFKDYNFDGSGLSVLLDVLSYNTQYNSFYLNMVANEMFLDTALQRSSVVSHAKLLNYIPASAIAPTAFVNVVVTGGPSSSSLTLPTYTNFLSESVNGVNYNFLSTTSTTVNTDTTGSATFSDIEIKQGVLVNYSFTVDSTANPSFTFEIPDSSIDTSTLMVMVQQSSTNTSYQIYNQTTPYSVMMSSMGTSMGTMGSSSMSSNMGSMSGSNPLAGQMIYFLQEGISGNYEIIFGDGVIGNMLMDGNIVMVSYISTQGTSSAGANNFVLMDSISGWQGTNAVVYGQTPSSQGSEKETIDSIKFQAPKAFAAQNRAVTVNDYITLIQQNNFGITFDAVNVWGGQNNNPPVYGQVFVCLKPTGSLTLTATQKQKIITQLLQPISIMTVDPVIVDPDYTFIKIKVNVAYNTKLTNLSSSQIQSLIVDVINNYATTALNTFNSTFSMSDLMIQIQNSNQSIIANEISIQIQKKIFPNITTPTTQTLYFGVPLEKGMFQSGVSSSPSVQMRDPSNLANIIDGVYIEEIPSATGGVSSVTVTNSGYGYQYTPTVAILGDGTGATAEAVINTDGTLRSISVLTSGNNYTSAIVTITSLSGDTTGTGASAVAILEGQYGTLRTYYNNSQQVKTILNPNAGTVDYVNGIVTLTSFGPIDIDNPLGELTITANPTTSIISSGLNKILTVDPYDPNAITVNVTAKTQ